MKYQSAVQIYSFQSDLLAEENNKIVCKKDDTIGSVIMYKQRKKTTEIYWYSEFEDNKYFL